MKEFLGKYKKTILLSIIILAAISVEFLYEPLNIGTNYTYVFKPLIWCFIVIITFVFFKNSTVPNHKYKKEVQFYVLITSLLYFLVYFVLGYAKGFANNPYDHSLRGILINLWTFIPFVIAKEYARYYMINNCSKKRIFLSVLAISLLFTLTELTYTNFSGNFVNNYTTARFFMESFIPNFAISMYLTYVSYFAGYQITIIYLLLPKLALFVFPILPGITWLLLAVMDISFPFFSYVYINYVINKLDKTYNRKEYKSVDLKGWLLMILSIALIVAFGSGYFTYSPLVIASDSMYPKISRGDLVIIKEIDPDDIKVGDIVRYRLESYYVVHRVKEIQETEDGKRQFIFKGDNNNSIDLYPVYDNQINGKIKIIIPYAGYPTLLLDELLDTNIGQDVKVETGRK